ncbi:hypothetical protein Tco_0899154, partial [Tanacetum coccineum]
WLAFQPILFNFVSYIQLDFKIPQPDIQGKLQHLVLTVGDLVIFEDPNKRQTIRRKVDIENLDGNITDFTVWDDMAREFDKNLVETMEEPVIIVVISCRGVRFSCEATITNVNRSKDWLHTSCAEYTRKVKDDNGVWECVDHEPQPEPTHRYSFKAFVSD